MKTKDIIKSLRLCKGKGSCRACMGTHQEYPRCRDEIMETAADRLEAQQKKIDELSLEAELLRGALAASGENHFPNAAKMVKDMPEKHPRCVEHWRDCDD